MEFNFFVGIDVSKDTLDFSLSSRGNILVNVCVENSSNGIKSALKEFKKQPIFSIETTLFCLEHTGIYNNYVISTLFDLKAKIWVESATHIKRSSGLQRGKSDKIDAQRIALFAYRNQDQMKLWLPKRIVVLQLKKLTTIRERLLLALAQLNKPIQEAVKFESKEVFKVIKDSCSKSIKSIKADIKEVEKTIKCIITKDESLKQLFEMITSVPGVGSVVACEMIITTNEFKDITESKKYACYAGVVPFEHSSGKCTKGKNRVSHFANKRVKKLLHLASLSTVRYDGEFKTYWLRKIEEGKHKMVVLNALKNKIIQRVFAVVKRGSKYEKDFLFAA